LVIAERSDEERFFVENTSDRELEDDSSVGMNELRSVGDGDVDRNARYCGKS